MADMSTTAARAIEGFQVLAEVLQDLDGTILSGWPHAESPTEDEALAIESTFHELGLAEPTMPESRRWYLAGQTVARIRRDKAERPRQSEPGTFSGMAPGWQL